MGEDFKGKYSNISSGEVLERVYSTLKEKHKPKEIFFREPARSIWEDCGNEGHFSMTHMKYLSAGIFKFGEKDWVISQGRNYHNNEKVYGDLIAFELYIPSIKEDLKTVWGNAQIEGRVLKRLEKSDNLDSLFVAHSNGSIGLSADGRFFELMKGKLDKVYEDFRVDKGKFKPETSNFLADSVADVLSKSEMPKGFNGLLFASKY